MVSASEHGRGRRLRMAVWGIGILILLIPLVATVVTDEVGWTGYDFAIAGVLVAATGIGFELVIRMSGVRAYRTAFGLALVGAFILMWANGAVGVIGSEDNPANAMYYGVLAVGVVWAFLARFEAPGMARAMYATALALAGVGVIALVAGLGQPWTGPGEIIRISLFFCVLFAGSGWLFQVAARRGAEGSAA